MPTPEREEIVVPDVVADATTSVGQRRHNQLTDVIEGLGGTIDALSGVFPGAGPYNTQMIAQPWTFLLGGAYSPFTLNRIGLSYGYMSYGLAQTVVGQPVDDAFRGGLVIESGELDEDDVKLLQTTLRRRGDIKAIKEALTWARLYGGAGLLVDVLNEDPKRPLERDRIAETRPFRLIAADRWELILSVVSINGRDAGDYGYPSETPFNYYGQPVHESRVFKILGREAPSFIRQRLQGWGMSELERCMRSINSFIKYQNLIFELLDEAKVDVYQIERFNEMLADARGSAMVTLRVQMSNWLKSYKNALVMDKNDTYEQKQLGAIFSGLADLYQELRLYLCSDLKFPLNKLFGESAEGFGSGQDAMENYNAMVEADVRERAVPICEDVIGLRCREVFGFEPEDLTVTFKPLRVLGAEEQERVATSKQNRVLALFDRGLETGQETMESLDKDELINVDTEVQRGVREPEPPGAQQAEDEDRGSEGGEGGNRRDQARRMDGKKLRWLRRQLARGRYPKEVAA